MVLSNIEIKKLCNNQNLITPFIEGNLKNSSYDLTVGDEFYCGKTDGSIITTSALAIDETFKIPAYGLAYIICNEYIELPNYLTARVSLRMPLIYQGLVLTVQPPFDPNYKGKVIVFLHNMSTAPVHLKRGERIVTMEFFYIINPDTTIINQRSVISLKQSIKNEVTSGLTDLVLKNNKSKSNYNIFFSVSLGVLTILLTIFVGFLSVAFTVPEKSFESYKNNIDTKYASEISGLNFKIEKLENQLNSLESSNQQKKTSIKSNSDLKMEK